MKRKMLISGLTLAAFVMVAFPMVIGKLAPNEARSAFDPALIAAHVETH